MMISDAFATVLAAGRAQFNQRVVEARRRFPAFDPAAFAEFLQTGVDSVVRATAEVAPMRVASVALVAYDMALELVGQGLAGRGARGELVGQAWHMVAPNYVRLVAEQPMEVLGALSNAVVNLAKIPAVRPVQWLQEMAALASYIDALPQLHALGQVLAWRAGVAHFRIGAIHAADQLPEVVALAALGVTDGMRWAAAREHLLADPWWRADADAEVGQAGREIGRFTGFGGEFAEPPEVRACPDGFLVRSANRYSFLIADAYGAVLHAATAEEFEHARSYLFTRTVMLSGSRLTFGRREIELDLPANRLAVTCNDHTVAVTSPFTHAIRLLPLQ